jgi:hypothetical protein
VVAAHRNRVHVGWWSAPLRPPDVEVGSRAIAVIKSTRVIVERADDPSTS